MLKIEKGSTADIKHRRMSANCSSKGSFRDRAERLHKIETKRMSNMCSQVREKNLANASTYSTLIILQKIENKTKANRLLVYNKKNSFSVGLLKHASIPQSQYLMITSGNNVIEYEHFTIGREYLPIGTISLVSPHFKCNFSPRKWQYKHKNTLPMRISLIKNILLPNTMLF